MVLAWNVKLEGELTAFSLSERYIFDEIGSGVFLTLGNPWVLST